MKIPAINLGNRKKQKTTINDLLLLLIEMINFAASGHSRDNQDKKTPLLGKKHNKKTAINLGDR